MSLTIILVMKSLSVIDEFLRLSLELDYADWPKIIITI